MRVVDPLREFLRQEAAGGIVLLVAAILAVVWANSPAGGAYEDLWEAKLWLGLELDLRHWVNDGLMALFFFVVGLEIKRELVCGELASPRAAALPAFAAVGGVVLPVLIFVLVVSGGEGARGWAIPAAPTSRSRSGCSRCSAIGSRAACGCCS